MDSRSDGGKAANSTRSTTCSSQGEIRYWGWNKGGVQGPGLLSPTIFGDVFQTARGPPRSSARGTRWPERSGPGSSSGPALGEGGEEGSRPGPARSPGPPWAWPCPRPRGLGDPDPEGRSALSLPGGNPAPALNSPLSTSLPFLAVAAFPMTGRWQEGVREGAGGAGAVPAAPQSEATPASARLGAERAPDAEAGSPGGKTRPDRSQELGRSPRQLQRWRRRADTPPSPSPCPPSLRAPGGRAPGSAWPPVHLRGRAGARAGSDVALQGLAGVPLRGGGSGRGVRVQLRRARPRGKERQRGNR